MKNTALGEHILIELYDCDANLLDDTAYLEEAFLEAAQKAHATVVMSRFHHFSPIGVSGVVVVQESHLALHTWPEYAYAAVDIFTCSPTMNYQAAFEHLVEKLKAQTTDFQRIERGKNLTPRPLSFSKS